MADSLPPPSAGAGPAPTALDTTGDTPEVSPAVAWIIAAAASVGARHRHGGRVRPQRTDDVRSAEGRDQLAALAAIPDDEVLHTAVAELFRDRIDADTASPALRAAHRADAARVPARVIRGTLAGIVGGLPSPRFRPDAEVVLARRKPPVLALHRRPEHEVLRPGTLGCAVRDSNTEPGGRESRAR